MNEQNLQKEMFPFSLGNSSLAFKSKSNGASFAVGRIKIKTGKPGQINILIKI